jgi:type I restriction enzyme S subunit
MKCQKIGDYLQEEILRNTDNLLGKEDVLGVTKDKTYIKTVANLNGIDLSNYKVVKPCQFAYSNRINIGSIALRYDTPCLVSPSYTVFSVNEAKILSEYLLLWLSRSEFLHYAFFYSMGTVKDEMDVDDIGNMEIPIPEIKVQQEIVNIHKCYIERQRIADALKEQINNICPVLIRGSLT